MTGNAEPFVDGPSGFRKRVGRALREHCILSLPDRAAVIFRDHVLCVSGMDYPTDFTVLATGSAAPDLLRGSGLRLDARGYAHIRQTLQTQGHPEVFAAGDCATLVDHPLPRSGVYAAHQGPVLAHNLVAALASRPFRHYTPQRRALYLLRTSKHNAIASWGRFSWSGRWMWHWKDEIDRRFIRRMHG
nr:FAD-dependent oxidoreductase [Acidihalobacter yilgarnensis]